MKKLSKNVKQFSNVSRTYDVKQKGKQFSGAEEGTRTPTPLREADFKSAASTFPPPRQKYRGGERI